MTRTEDRRALGTVHGPDMYLRSRIWRKQGTGQRGKPQCSLLHPFLASTTTASPSFSPVVLVTHDRAPAALEGSDYHPPSMSNGLFSSLLCYYPTCDFVQPPPTIPSPPLSVHQPSSSRFSWPSAGQLLLQVLILHQHHTIPIRVLAQSDLGASRGLAWWSISTHTI